MASLEIHFVDTASGQCVQTLTVDRNDLTPAQIRAELGANKGPGRTLAFPAQGHVCAATPPDADQEKRDRLRALRTKGWAALTDPEKVEAQSLRFDLGLGD